MISNKLRSHSGATMIFALVTLMVVIMVAAVILNAAQTNITRTDRARAEQQAYLTDSSAANLLMAQIAGDSVSYDIITTKTTTIDEQGNSSTSKSVSQPKNWKYNESEDGLTCCIPELITGWVQDRVSGNTLKLKQDLTISSSVDGSDLDDVSVKMSMDGYDLSAVIIDAGRSEKFNVPYSYTITLSIIGTNEGGKQTDSSRSETPTKVVEKTTMTYTVSWSESDIKASKS